MTGILTKSGLDRVVPPMNYDPTNGNPYTYPNFAIRPDTFRNAPKNEKLPPGSTGVGVPAGGRPSVAPAGYASIPTTVNDLISAAAGGRPPGAPAGGASIPITTNDLISAAVGDRPPGVTKGKDDPNGTPITVPEDGGKTKPAPPNTATAPQATPYSEYTERLMKSLFEPTQRPQDSSVMGSLGSALLNGLTAGGYLQGKQIAIQNARDLKTQDYQDTLQNVQKMNTIGALGKLQLDAQMRSEIQAATAAAGNDPDAQAKAAALVMSRYGNTNALNAYSAVVNATSPNVMALVPGVGLDKDGYPYISDPGQFTLYANAVHPQNPLAAWLGGSGGGAPQGQNQVGDQPSNRGTTFYIPETN